MGYLIGAFPTGVVVTRLWGAPDVRQEGSGHVGATNTFRQAGLGAAVLVALVDLLKGVGAVLVGLALTGDAWVVPVAGHPPWQGIAGQFTSASRVVWDWRQPGAYSCGCYLAGL